MKPTNLQEHPEGGRYKEVYRSKLSVDRAGEERSSLTHIYFSLRKNEVSHFHKVSSDEVWNLYKGDGLYLYQWDGTGNAPETIELSAKANCYCHVIPAGYWQAAIPIESEILVGCSVAPGFEFADFEMLQNESSEALLLRQYFPSFARFIP